MPSEGQILKVHGQGLPAVCKAWGVQRAVRVLLSSEKKTPIRFFTSVLFSRLYGRYRHPYRDVLGWWCIHGKIVCVCALYGGLEVC